jgi:hypothetical protein
MGQAQHVEVGLVDRIDDLDHPFRHERRKGGNMPGHHDQEGEQQPDDGDRHDRLRPDEVRELCDLSAAAPGGKHEHELPAEWVEIPGRARRIGGDVPIEDARQDVEDHGGEKRQIGAAHQAPDDEGRRQDQRDEERQHVEIDRLVAQRDRLTDQDVRVLQEIIDVELVLIHRIVEAARGARDLRGEEQEQQDMRDV